MKDTTYKSVIRSLRKYAKYVTADDTIRIIEEDGWDDGEEVGMILPSRLTDETDEEYAEGICGWLDNYIPEDVDEIVIAKTNRRKNGWEVIGEKAEVDFERHRSLKNPEGFPLADPWDI